MQMHRVAAGALLFLVAVAGAHGATGFSNTTPITINDNANASPSPSVISVPGPTPITNVTVLLSNMSHARLADLTILLVAPGGQKIQLLAGAAGSCTAQDIRIAEEGRAFGTGESLSSANMYRPTALPAPMAMPAPAPGLPYVTTFAPLIGTDAQGNWSLYVRDNVSGVSGSIGGGWSLFFAGAGSAEVTPEFTYQGVLKDAGAGANGLFDVRLRFFSSPISQDPAVGEAVAFGVPIQSGVFTARFSPPEVVFGEGLQRWVDVSVKGPGDADFVVVGGRERVTTSPYANFATLARTAELAEVANTAVTVKWGSITQVPTNVANAFSPFAAAAGNAIVNTNTGNVLIGTANGTSKLTVNGTIESTTGGVKFPDDTVQTTAATTSVVGSRSVLITLGDIAPGAQLSVGFSMPGSSFVNTDVVVVSPSDILPSGVGILYARVSGVAAATIVVRNFSGSTVTIPQMTWTVKVIR